jgi:hypothetical protein
MTTTTDAENKPKKLIATEPPVPAPPPAAPATTAIQTTSTPTPTPSLRSQNCCKVHRTRVDYNVVTGASVYGTTYMYCGELTCLHQPCIHYRIHKKFAIYNNAFGTGVDIFFDILNTNDINIAAIELKKLFKQYLILDCFDHMEFFATDPVNRLVNTSIFRKVHDYQMELLVALEHHLVQQPHLGVTTLFDAKRVRHRNININKPSKKIPTIDGYYASPGPNIGIAVGKKVSYLPIEKVTWRVHPIQTDGTFDMTKTIDVGYQAARTVYKQQIVNLYDYDIL